MLLTPFTSSPRVEFDKVKLGRSGVRRLLIRNPGDKPLDVILDKLPKDEKGFSIDYVSFTLGGREETILLIGWTPSKAGGVRESFIVKFGGKFSAQVILIGSCVDPDARKRQAALKSSRVLTPRNSNVRAGGRPSVASSKLNAPAPAKMSIPSNPIVRKSGSPPKSLISGVSPVKSKPRALPPPKFVCGGTFNPREFSKAEDFVSLSQSPRRETYVQERPTPTSGDVMESTPIVRREATTKAETGGWDSRISNIMPPPPALDVRRQTFLPSKSSLPAVTSVEASEEEVDIRRQTFVKLPEAPAPVRASETDNVADVQPINEVKPAQNTPQEVETKAEAPVNLSIAPLNLSAKPKVLTQLLHEISNMENEPLDLSLPTESLTRQSPEKKAEISLVSSPAVAATPRRYCPRVSDISLPDSPTPVSRTPLRDPRLAQLMSNMNMSGYSNLDLSLGSQFGDCSLAVNLASPSRNREMDFEDELEYIEENKENIDEDELDLIASARGTSALGKSSSSYTEKSPRRLSTGTIVKSGPSVESDLLPTVVESTDHLHTEDVSLHIGQKLSQIVIEEEIITNEVVEEIIEYEFEVTGGQKTLVGERQLGKVVTRETETVSRTPKLERRAAQLDVSRMIEQHLSNDIPVQVGASTFIIVILHFYELFFLQSRPRSVDLAEEDVDKITGESLGQVFNISLHKPVNIEKIDEKAPDNPSLSGVEAEVEKLPGLKGSPRISNQVVSHPDNFLQVTINETSFLPPSPDDPRRCSTGVKNKENQPAKTPSPNSAIRKSLFGVENEVQAGVSQDVILNSQGFVLPVIECADTEGKRLSTDTYIAGPSPRLDTIQEEAESVSKSNVQTSVTITTETTDTEAVTEVVAEPVPEPSTEKTVSVAAAERKALKPRRSLMTYNSRNIESLSRPQRKTEEEVEISGLMFVPLTPGSTEKRKSEKSSVRSEQIKRTRTSVATPTSRPSVRAVKNPVLAKPKTKEPAKQSVRSLPSRPSLSRVVNSTRKLNLVTSNKRTSVVHHPNPFASRNIYYDEKWVEKQERGFSKWLNFFLTPQLLDDNNGSLPKTVDIANLWSQCSRDVKEPRAPTREEMSLRQYTVKIEMNRLRKKACRIWQSREVATVVRKVELEVEKMRLAVRKDRNITKDVGMKQSLLKLVLSYNPLWLRIGLETIFGELLPVANNADLVGLSRFLITRWLSNPDILSEFAHPSVPHSYRDGCQDSLNKFALKKFLELVYFLDLAKESKLIRHNPCLFCPDSQHKSSRDILLQFAKDYLAGEGDITKHLAYMNYVVFHKQSKLDEFDFAVTNIKTDLRCGVRLSRVAELLAGSEEADVMKLLRVPSVSRLQKVHNVDIALGALRRGGADIRKEITAKDLVDGHREKTLELLWSIIFGYQLAAILDLDKIKEEIIHLKRSLAAKSRLGEAMAQSGQSWLSSLASRSPVQTALAGERLELLLHWVRLVLVHYGVEIENWTTSWCDGRALCLLVHHYQPGLLARGDIRDVTSLTHQADNQNLDDSLDFCYGSKHLDPKQCEKFMENEKYNFKLLLNKVSFCSYCHCR